MMESPALLMSVIRWQDARLLLLTPFVTMAFPVRLTNVIHYSDAEIRQ
jgi:hypothetical protein